MLQGIEGDPDPGLMCENLVEFLSSVWGNCPLPPLSPMGGIARQARQDNKIARL